ncbi:SAP protein, partial [Climacteris rufus]|nr:SAP protein [Climacteris rufus]
PPGWVLKMTTGLGAPGGGCGVPPSAWCRSWVTALRCGALEHCPHLTQGPPDVDACALCQQLFSFLRHASNQSAVQVPTGTGDRVGSRCWGLCALLTPCRAIVQVLVQHLLRELQQKPWQVCAQLKLCHGEPGGAPAAPMLKVPST